MDDQKIKEEKTKRKQRRGQGQGIPKAEGGGERRIRRNRAPWLLPEIGESSSNKPGSGGGHAMKETQRSKGNRGIQKIVFVGMEWNMEGRGLK